MSATTEGKPQWRKTCKVCGDVDGGYIVMDGDDSKAVSFLGPTNARWNVERLMPGDDGYPVKLGRGCNCRATR